MDFMVDTDRLKFEVGQTISCSNVSIVKDDDIEPSETFTVNLLRLPDLDPRIALNPNTATVEVLDNDGMLEVLFTSDLAPVNYHV